MEFKGKWIPSNNAVHDEKGKCICITYENKTANALLISKVPELLEALKKMCEYHEKNASWDKGDNGYYKAKQLIKEATEF